MLYSTHMAPWASVRKLSWDTYSGVEKLCLRVSVCSVSQSLTYCSPDEHQALVPLQGKRVLFFHIPTNKWFYKNSDFLTIRWVKMVSRGGFNLHFLILVRILVSSVNCMLIHFVHFPVGHPVFPPVSFVGVSLIY